ncbi:MAG TPA: phospholipase D-like domain-containing protein [Xanthobacteraceae bacterium]|nr:phospholipase D-like domain-containing protein [Xanthobacteraceae bacterium]
MNFARDVDQVITQNLDKLRKPGVLSVRPGYQVVDGWPTKKPAIVVTVANKNDDVPAADRLPETLGGYAVDVRQADPLQQLRASKPALYTSVAASVTPELERPVFPYERDLSGQPLAPLAETVEALRKPAKQQIKYVPPAGAPLHAVDEKMTITCHASPDAGWPTLKAFLDATSKTLTVGMYDFTSAHIAQTVETTMGKGGRALNLVLDHPPGKSNREQTDDQTVEDLTSAIGKRLDFAWALERSDPKVATWIFPSAYHIKVAVRDKEAFWLSSGNWNSTNQPDIDPLTDPSAAAPVVKKSDRDWHVIVEHEGLAQLYEKYLLNDLSVASKNQTSPTQAAALADALAQLAEPEILLAAKVPQQYFPPKKITAKMKIQPILTPDNYVGLILALINSAEKSFYMQTQYINYPADPQDPKNAQNQQFMALVAAVAKKINAGLDVRLIMSQYETNDKLEVLQDAGIDLSHVRIQANVHNKGIVVDSQVVAVGSQNWSGDGVLRNRDATVIIYNEEAAQYWEEIFIHDWTKMASQHAVD